MTPISTLSIRCERPYAFTRDCSNVWGPERELELHGIRVRIAGTEDEKTILLTEANPIGSALLDGLTLDFITNTNFMDSANNAAYHAVKSFLAENSITVVKAVPIVSLGDLYGYVLELDAPAYGLLLTREVQEDPKGAATSRERRMRRRTNEAAER